MYQNVTWNTKIINTFYISILKGFSQYKNLIILPVESCVPGAENNCFEEKKYIEIYLKQLTREHNWIFIFPQIFLVVLSTTYLKWVLKITFI